MEIKKELKIAKEISRIAHAGQKRWGGEPYITHPKAVAKLVEGDELKIVAWLHDVIEDTHLKKEDLVFRGISKHLVEAVDILSKRKHQSYLDYILKVSKNEIAKAVKIADLEHNLSDLKKGSMKDKYLLALHILETTHKSWLDTEFETAGVLDGD